MSIIDPSMIKTEPCKPNDSQELQQQQQQVQMQQMQNDRLPEPMVTEPPIVEVDSNGKVKKKRKYKKKPPKPKPPKPGQVHIATALDGTILFCCPECQLAYPEKGDLEQHLTVHKIERRYICDICGAGLKRKEHLERHKLGHSPERPHICSVCMKGFKRKEHLNLHFVIHSGDKTEVSTIAHRSLNHLALITHLMICLIFRFGDRFVLSAAKDSIERTIYGSMRNRMRLKDLKRKWMRPRLRRRRHRHRRRRTRYQPILPHRRRHSTIRMRKTHTTAWWQRTHQKTFSSNCSNNNRTPETVKRSFYKWVAVRRRFRIDASRIPFLRPSPSFHIPLYTIIFANSHVTNVNDHITDSHQRQYNRSSSNKIAAIADNKQCRRHHEHRCLATIYESATSNYVDGRYAQSTSYDADNIFGVNDSMTSAATAPTIAHGKTAKNKKICAAKTEIDI